MPVRYAELVLEVADARGADGEGLLDASGIAAELLGDPDARVPVSSMATLVRRAIDATGEPGLGYEIGLGSSLTSHGIMGFGMLASPTVRDAILLGVEFLQLRVPVLSAALRVDGDVAAVSVVETVPLGDLRQVLLDTFLVKLARLGRALADGRLGSQDLELWFDYARPAYHERLADRLPPMRFGMGSNEVRFDAAVLELRPATADPANARLVERQCRRELDQLGLDGDVVGQVRAALRRSDDGYPTLGQVAEHLHTSSRTLKRRLQARGTSFHRLLDDTRRADAVRLLTSTTLTVEQVARRLGYAEASGFRRAFQSWTGTTPGDYRDRQHAVTGGS